MIIAIGSGVYAGLSSTTVWRGTSYDASYAATASNDLVVRTAEGTFAEPGRLPQIVSFMDDPEMVVVAEERLVVPTQVDGTDAAGETLLVPGRIVGVDVADGGPHVDRLVQVGGRSLTEADDGESVVVLDSHFANHHELPDEGSLVLKGGTVDYVGTGYTPEYFVVASDQTSFLAEAGFAVVFAPLATAQALGGAEGSVNELAVLLADGVDPQEAIEAFEAAAAQVAPDLALDIEWIENNRLYRRLYDDIEGDQRLFNIFALLILGGAAFAAFNLTNRIVEAQRREIGIGMALGLDRWKIAVRPLLMGVQIAVLGVAFGVLFGLWVGSLMSGLNQDFVPLPVWRDSFQPAVFFRGAALGLVLVVTATVIPVVRSVRVDPIDAIHTRRSLAGSGGLAPTLGRLPLPGNSVHQLPFRNVVRQPRRTILTTFGIGAAIAVLIGVTGMLDSFVATIENGEEEILGDSPDRATVTLDFFYADDAPEVVSIDESPLVAVAEPQLVVGGWLVPDGAEDGEEIESLVTLLDLDSELWVPTAIEGSLVSSEPSLVISEKAAEDLDVGAGDTVTFRHPLREGLGYSFVESEIRVGAVHANPYRFVTYMDRSDAELMGLAGIVNAVSVQPSADTELAELKRTLFGADGVASVEGVNEVASSIRDAIEDLLGFLAVIQGFVLLMALLIAFNTSSIASDERRREHATMLAFGLPTRSVMGLMLVESLLLGILGTIVGIVVGRVLLAWLVRVLLPGTVPDIGFTVDVAGSTYLIAAVLGVVAVTVAPLLTWRRLSRMDVPSTLRIVE